MRVFTAALCAETNTFSPLPTSIASFKEGLLFRPGEHPDASFEGTAALFEVRRRAAIEGWDVSEGTCACAYPAGVVVRRAYEALRDEILAQLSAAMPVDMVALSMHGAMVADGYEDCEGDMLARVRALVGEETTVGALLDPHCHLTDEMVKASDLIVIFKEYPHTDFRERAEELVELMVAKTEGRIKPAISVHDCSMIDVFHTTREPMLSFVEKIKKLEKHGDALSISVAHGFPWGDVPSMGSCVLVITDNDPPAAAALANDLARDLWDMRGDAMPAVTPLEDAIAIATVTQGPVIFVDSPDNPGGGAPGDATHVLAALLNHSIDNACVGPLYDPGAVKLAFSAGEGAVLPMRIGGKMGVASGQPIDCEVTVVALKENMRQNFCGTGVSLGDSAAVAVGNIVVVLTSSRAQALDPSLFTELGIDPRQRDVIVVKSSQHFYAGFSSVTRNIIYLDYPGSLGLNFKDLPFRKIKRPKWPFDEMGLNPHKQVIS